MNPGLPSCGQPLYYLRVKTQLSVCIYLTRNSNEGQVTEIPRLIVSFTCLKQKAQKTDKKIWIRSCWICTFVAEQWYV